MHRSLLSQLLFPLCSLLLLSGCGGMDFRSLPTDDPLAFEARMQDVDPKYWKPGVAVELPLTLASEAEAAREETFQVLSATLDDGTDVLAHVTHDECFPLTLQENTLYYTPQGPGEHVLRLRIGLDWEPEGAQETMCQVQVPRAPWRVRGQVSAEGGLSFKVDHVDAWREETWTLLPHRAWSAGVVGELHHLQPGGSDMVWEVEDEETLSYGENNNLTVNLTASSLNDPQVCFTVQGPDGVEKAVSVDLLPLCVANLRDGMGELEGNLADRLPTVREHVQTVEELYALEEETVLDANRNREKVREVETQLGTMERYKAEYDRDLDRLTTLDQQDTEYASRQLPAFQSAQQRLEDAINSLKSTRVQLQEKCTTAHEVLAKVLRTEGENAQEAIDILLEDPRLEVNDLIADVRNGETFSLLQVTDLDVTRKLLERGANPNIRNNEGVTPLFYAIGEHNMPKVEALLSAGADVNVRDNIGVTPLHVAVKRGDLALAQLLFEKGANVNHKQRMYGHTPLMAAVARPELPNREEIIALLLSSEDIDITIPDSFGITPLRNAISFRNFSDNEHIIRMLEDHASGRSQRQGQNGQQA